MEIGECIFCAEPIDNIFSLCKTCNEKTDYWNETTDTYHMKDGTKNRFSQRDGVYLLEK